MASKDSQLPPGQQLVAPRKWPVIGEREPRPGSERWTVEVAGQVAGPRVWALEELKRLPVCTRTIDIHCVTRWSKLAVEFHGVSLLEVIRHSEPLHDARYVSFVARSERGHSTSLPLEDLEPLDPIFAWEANGEPLAIEHGGPLRVIVPGRYFYKSLKWLTRIELLTDDKLGFWESTAGYHNTADPWRQQRYIATSLTKQEARTILKSRDFRDRDLRGIEAPGYDLAGLQAQGSKLRNANFQGANLHKATFDRANLSNANLRLADLRETSFLGVDLEGADLSGADVRGAVFSEASLVAATFVDLLQTGAKNGAVIDASTKFDSRVFDELTPEQAEYISQWVKR